MQVSPVKIGQPDPTFFRQQRTVIEEQQAPDEDDGGVEGEDNQEEEDRESSDLSPDAKLVSFFSGLLLSEPVSRAVKEPKLFEDLFVAWSVGLLSASLPWRMKMTSSYLLA